MQSTVASKFLVFAYICIFISGFYIIRTAHSISKSEEAFLINYGKALLMAEQCKWVFDESNQKRKAKALELLERKLTPPSTVINEMKIEIKKSYYR